MRLCGRCGSPVGDESRFCSNCGSTVGPGDLRGRPIEVWIGIGLVALGAALILIETLLAIKDIWPIFSEGGALATELGLFAVLVLTIFGSFGVGMAAIAWLLYTGDQVGQWLAIALCATVSAGEFFSQGTSGTGKAAGAVALIVIVDLLLPRARGFFKGHDVRPIGVVFTSVLIVFFAWCFLVFSAACLIADKYDRLDLVYGILFIGLTVGLLSVNRGLRRGSNTARILASLLFAALGVVVLVLDHSSPTSISLAGLCGAALVALWAVPSSQQHFAINNLIEVPARLHWRTDPSVLDVSTPRYEGTGFIAGVAVVGLVGIIGGTANAYGSQPVGFSSEGIPPYASDTSPAFEQPQDSIPNETVPVTQTTVGSPLPDSDYTHRWTISAAAQGGYAEAVEIDAGAPEHFQEGMTNGPTTAGSACSIDPQTDAVIPGRIIMTNATSGFGSVTGISIGGFGSSMSTGDLSSSVMWEQSFSDSGAQCETGSFSTQSQGAISPSTTAQGLGFFVVTNYYSPNAPSGNAGVLAQLPLSIANDQPVTSSSGDGSSQGPTSLDFTVTGMSGPGAAESQAQNWFFLLDGSSASSDAQSNF